MTDSSFDRITRLLAGSRSRRQMLAALGALAAARLRPAHAASQIEIPACGEAGAVCTPIAGCCSGLVCATSTLNPAYGVCVTGEGDMLPVTNDLVVPGSEGITEELAGQASEAAADATEGESLLAAQEAEIQSRRTARNTRQVHAAQPVQSNRDDQQSRKTTNRTTPGQRPEPPEPKAKARGELRPGRRTGRRSCVCTTATRPRSCSHAWKSLTDPGVFQDLSATILAKGT